MNTAERERERERESRRLFSRESFVLPGLLTALCLAMPVPAQSELTFHIPVDPIHGDDAAALAANPAPGAAVEPLDQHPDPFSLIAGHLRHAPYSFLTVTGALAWINSKFPAQPGGGRLPWSNDNGKVLGHIVIHCMPGLYGPTSDPGVDYDEASGLFWNGESFPLKLPGRVSIQGTSALDTIFDARDDQVEYVNTSVFHFDTSVLGEPGSNYDKSFIDSVTIRACRFESGTPDSGSKNGCAIVFVGAGSDPVRASISNCFLVGNDVGIKIEPLGDQHAHEPRIIGNTLAWNHIGIFNQHNGEDGQGLPLILNNVIDPLRPLYSASTRPRWLDGIGAFAVGQPASCFEGLSAGDLQANTVNPPATNNYNAYLSNRVNLQNAWPFNASPPRVGGGLPAPVVDLRGAIHFNTPPTADRGSLFLADIFYDDGIRCAPHDLRLAPIARKSSALGGGYVLNPLVNQGISGPSAGTITFVTANKSRSINADEPGLPMDGQAVFGPWDFDCEGFGNPREAKRRSSAGAPANYFATPHGTLGIVDLGADEMGEVIVSGYLDGTRIFSRPHATPVHQNTALLLPCEDLYMFNVDSSDFWLTPQFNQRTDLGPVQLTGGSERARWYYQLGAQHNPFLAIPGMQAYTDGLHSSLLLGPSSRLDLTRPAFFRQPGDPTGSYPYFPRSRVCDIGPHILPDIALTGTSRPVDYAEYDFVPASSIVTPERDIFASNAWHSMADSSMRPNVNDNGLLYIDPNFNKELLCGTLNPPLTIFNDPLNALYPESYLYRDSTATPPHNLGAWFTSGAYVVGASGRSPAHRVPYIGNIGWYGIRVNMELFDPDSPSWEGAQGLGDPVNNLQTFLIVQGFERAPLSPASMSSSGSPLLSEQIPLIDDARARADALRNTSTLLQSR